MKRSIRVTLEGLMKAEETLAEKEWKALDEYVSRQVEQKKYREFSSLEKARERLTQKSGPV